MNQLTNQETKIARLIAKGYVFKEIADMLCVSTHTIHTHTKNIRKKLEAKNIADITRIYILSLDNPRQVLYAFVFAVMQISMVLTSTDFEARKPTNRIVNRTVKGRRKIEC